MVGYSGSLRLPQGSGGRNFMIHKECSELARHFASLVRRKYDKNDQPNLIKNWQDLHHALVEHFENKARKERDRQHALTQQFEAHYSKGTEKPKSMEEPKNMEEIESTKESESTTESESVEEDLFPPLYEANPNNVDNYEVTICDHLKRMPTNPKSQNVAMRTMEEIYKSIPEEIKLIILRHLKYAMRHQPSMECSRLYEPKDWLELLKDLDSSLLGLFYDAPDWHDAELWDWELLCRLVRQKKTQEQGRYTFGFSRRLKNRIRIWRVLWDLKAPMGELSTTIGDQHDEDQEKWVEEETDEEDFNDQEVYEGGEDEAEDEAEDEEEEEEGDEHEFMVEDGEGHEDESMIEDS